MRCTKLIILIQTRYRGFLPKNWPSNIIRKIFWHILKKFGHSVSQYLGGVLYAHVLLVSSERWTENFSWLLLLLLKNKLYKVILNQWFDNFLTSCQKSPSMTFYEVRRESITQDRGKKCIDRSQNEQVLAFITQKGIPSTKKGVYL